MTKMNWERVRLENIITEYGRLDFRSYQHATDFSDDWDERDTRRQDSVSPTNNTSRRSRRAEIRRAVNRIDDQEFGKLEYAIEEWIGQAPEGEVSDVVSKLDEDLGYAFLLIFEKMTKRQKEMLQKFKNLSRKAELSKKRGERKRKRKLI
jgi:hypothetical protein